MSGFAALLFILLAGCATTTAPGRDFGREHPWIQGERLTRVVVDTYGDGNPARIEYYRAGRRLAVEDFDERGERTTEGRVPDGVVREFHREGVVKAEVPFRGGMRHGLARYYHEEGRIQARVEWVNDRKEGTATIYRADGSLQFEEEYEAGILVRRKAFTPGGELIYEQEF